MEVRSTVYVVCESTAQTRPWGQERICLRAGRGDGGCRRWMRLEPRHKPGVRAQPDRVSRALVLWRKYAEPGQLWGDHHNTISRPRVRRRRQPAGGGGARWCSRGSGRMPLYTSTRCTRCTRCTKITRISTLGRGLAHLEFECESDEGPDPCCWTAPLHSRRHHFPFPTLPQCASNVGAPSSSNPHLTETNAALHRGLMAVLRHAHPVVMRLISS